MHYKEKLQRKICLKKPWTTQDDREYLFGLFDRITLMKGRVVFNCMACFDLNVLIRQVEFDFVL